MSDKEQIEEIAKVIEVAEQIARDAHCGYPSPAMYAKALYWKGYRKQREGKWIRHKENCLYNKCSICSYEHCREDNFCPNCGAKMKGAE